MRSCNLFDSPECRAVTCTLEKHAFDGQTNEVCNNGELHIFCQKEVKSEFKNLIEAHKRDGYPIELYALMTTFKKYNPHNRIDAEDYNILSKLIDED